MTTKYEYQDSGADGAYSQYDPYRMGQCFTVGATGHTVTSIKIIGYRVGTLGTVYLEIRRTDAGHLPTGSVLTSGNIDGSGWSTSPAWHEITVTEYTLLANTEYVITAHNTGTDPNKSAWNENTSSGGNGTGPNLYSTDSGSTWVLRGADNYFAYEVWGNPLSHNAYSHTFNQLLGCKDVGPKLTKFKTVTRTFTQLLGLKDATKWVLGGLTKDSNGNILGNCTVLLYKTSDHSYVASTTSDANGKYSFSGLDHSTQYFVVAFKSGSPDVEGATDNNLTGGVVSGT